MVRYEEGLAVASVPVGRESHPIQSPTKKINLAEVTAGLSVILASLFNRASIVQGFAPDARHRVPQNANTQR